VPKEPKAQRQQYLTRVIAWREIEGFAVLDDLRVWPRPASLVTDPNPVYEAVLYPSQGTYIVQNLVSLRKVANKLIRL
jgi:hypothetical protein